MNRCNQALRKARKSKSNDDWKSYKTLRNKCNKKIKKAKSNHYKKVLNDSINKPKKFWSQTKNVLPGKSQSMANLSTDKHPSRNILSCFYSTMASKMKKSTYRFQLALYCQISTKNYENFQISIYFSIFCAKRVKIVILPEIHRY